MVWIPERLMMGSNLSFSLIQQVFVLRRIVINALHTTKRS